jgi:hypothetical protein
MWCKPIEPPTLWHRRLRSTILLAVWLPVAHGEVDSTSQQDQLGRATELWAQHGATNYTYDIREGGVCGSTTVHVTIRHGQCVDARSWRHLHRLGHSCNDRTVEELLSEIRREMDANRPRLDIRFDQQHGFPRYLAVTMPDDPPDQDWGYEISHFRILR